MQTGEFRSLRERALSRDPVPLNLYRFAVLLERSRLTPDKLERVADGLDTLMELHDAAGITGMSTQAAMDAGLLSEADGWGAFGIVPPERGPA
jgi:hypothetical protein